MLRLNNAFKDKAKIAYLTAGDIGVSDKDAYLYNSQIEINSYKNLDNLEFIVERSIEYFMALVNASVNVLEIGVPFSDPIADGLIIQKAMQRALKNNINLDLALKIVAGIRAQTEVAIVVFTYYNIIQYDLGSHLYKIKQSGADGVLVVDLPLEEAEKLISICLELDLAPIMVAAPSSSYARVEQLSLNGRGFLYYACRKGITGIRNGLAEELIEQIKAVKYASKLPIAVGFGVSNQQMVKKILNVADGCVIGSYFVNAIALGKTPQELKIMAQEIFTC